MSSCGTSPSRCSRRSAAAGQGARPAEERGPRRARDCRPHQARQRARGRRGGPAAVDEMRAASSAYGRRMTTHASLAALFPAAFVSAGRVTFAEAVREHQDEVYGVALRILGDRDAAREAASAALLKAYRSWERYDQTRPVRHWLLRIAANEAISIGRSPTP